MPYRRRKSPRKLELIGVILKGKPSERTKVVLRHSLELLRKQMKRNLEETQRLLNDMQ